MAHGDWISGKRTEIILRAKKIEGILAIKGTVWGIPQAFLSAFSAAIAALDLAIVTATENNNTHNTEMVRTAQVALVKEMRYMKSHYFLIPPLTDQDYRDLIGKEPKPSHTPLPPPTTIPVLRFDSSIIRQITVYFQDEGSERRGKPTGVHGVELRWAILDHVPTDINELINTEIDTKSPFTLRFSQEERGKSLYTCPRWENSKPQKGPWGAIGMAVIP
ncbi:hypothetical protein ACYULU_08175 [Breznakiellaceae bacterium SP9]